MLSNVRGTRDLLPEYARRKVEIIETCRYFFELYGFEPLETPILEYLETLTKKGIASEELKEEIYTFEDKSKRFLALRFDLTVPLARVFSTNKQIAKPFKRYQIGEAFRYERPQAKRYREFTQADADIIGSDSVFAELELILMSKAILDALGIKAKMKINSRELLKSLAKKFGMKEKEATEAFREIDKAEKMGWNYVENRFMEKKLSLEFLEAVRTYKLSELKNLQGYERISKIFELLDEFDARDFVEFDLKLARGLDYYTSTIMEIKIENGPSIAGGGRYDEMLALFGREACAIGISFGIDRIVDYLGAKETKTKILIFSVQKELEKEAFKIAQKIRALGISAEFELSGRGISKALEYANKKKIPFVGILGKKEFEKGLIRIRNMKSGEEKLFELKELEKLQNYLGSN